MHENDIGTQIVDAAYQIHLALGPGLLESVYEIILFNELKSAGLHVERQKAIPIRYKQMVFEEGFRADLIVEEKVIVELKSVESIQPVHGKQVLTYLKLMDYRLGYLINFNSELIRDGITRIANHLR